LKVFPYMNIVGGMLDYQESILPHFGVSSSFLFLPPFYNFRVLSFLQEYHSLSLLRLFKTLSIRPVASRSLCLLASLDPSSSKFSIFSDGHLLFCRGVPSWNLMSDSFCWVSTIHSFVVEGGLASIAAAPPFSFTLFYFIFFSSLSVPLGIIPVLFQAWNSVRIRY
jgi:hypothetical protein